MSCEYYFRKFLSVFDAYSSPFLIQFHYHNSFQTHFGGLISLILYIILLAAFIFLYVLLHKKEEQKIVSFDMRYDIPPQFDINANEEEIVYSKKENFESYFLPAFYIVDKKKNKVVEKDEMENLVTITLSHKTRGKKNDTKESTLVPCVEKHTKLKEFLKTNAINSAFCFNSDKYHLQGDYLNRNEISYQYLTIELDKKSGDLSNYQLVILYTDYTINNKLHDKSPIEFSTKQLQIDPIDGFELSFDIFVALDEFYSQDNLYAHWSEKHKQKISRVSRISKNVKLGSTTLISVNFRSDYYYVKYIRTYKTFFEFIYQIGGLWKVLVFIGGLIVVGINLSLMNVSISNQMYNMIHPDNESAVLTSYEKCLQKEEEKGRTAPIFLSLNPILKQLSYEYYKFERNRGMEFTVKEALSKLFCCCCKIKAIQQKDKIFKESGREIEKVLDTTAVAKFAQQTIAMKDLLLQHNAVMLGYMKQHNISYENLYLIRQDLIQHQIFNSASPMSITYYKQNYFINAFITMRNQGDLTKKDLLLIDVMKLNEELIAKFFVAYYDRLKLIYPERFIEPPRRKTEESDVSSQIDNKSNIIS